MSRYPPLWAVLAPCEPAWLEGRARVIVMTEEDEEDGKTPPFEFIPGSGRYHAIVGLDGMDVGAEMKLAEKLSLECQEPVYSIECANDPWAVMSWQNGALEVREVDPGALAQSLGCPLPGSEDPPDLPVRKPLRSASLLEGIRAEQAQRALEEHYGTFPPGHFHLEDTPRGLLLSSRPGGGEFADINLAERFPGVALYGVTASPTLDLFFVLVMRADGSIGKFSHPPPEFSSIPALGEIKGERSPERILAALGIPVEWFRSD